MGLVDMAVYRIMKIGPLVSSRATDMIKGCDRDFTAIKNQIGFPEPIQVRVSQKAT